MADAITIKALQDASLDAKSLEEVVNGDEVKQVTTRKGETYPSVKKAIKTLFENGGLPAIPFATKALMTASALVDGDYAQVTDDTDVGDNGLYIKTEGAWVKSAYDPMSYTDTEINKVAASNRDINLINFQDAEGKTFASFDEDAGLRLSGLSSSVQSLLSGLNKDKEDYTFSFLDAEDSIVALIDLDGRLIVNDVITKGGSLENRFLSPVDNGISKQDMLRNNDYLIAIRDPAPRHDSFNIFTHSELNAVYAFAPSLCRISKNEYLVFCEARNGGDFGVSWLVQRKLTINDDYTTTLGAVSIFADRGTEDGQPFSCINTCVVKVETGAHTGRIYVYYLKVFYQNQRDVTFYKYSDDNGETWSAEVDMTLFFPDIATWVLVAPGAGGKAIQLKEGAHRGRIIIPCWHGDEQYYDNIQTGLLAFILYSDDGGETYQIGATSSFAGSNECQVAELDGGGFMLLVRDGSTTKRTEVSFDGGLTLEQPSSLGNINSNKVESGFCQFKNIYDLSVPKLMITSPTEVNRYNLGLYSSYDNGKNFELVKILSQGLASYSDILPIDESHILTAHSAGDGTTFNRFIEANIVNLKSILLGE